MQLVILIMVNILIASIFYLVISLKLERSATEFRSKRLRKEMEELINEFNHTAERNLALLEYKINILRELLKKSDTVPSLDITINDESGITANTNTRKKKTNKKEEKTAVKTINTPENIEAILEKSSFDISKRSGNELHDNSIVYLERKTAKTFSETKSQVPTVAQQLSEIARLVFNKFSQYIDARYNKKMTDTFTVHSENASRNIADEYDVFQSQYEEKSSETPTPIVEDELIAMYNDADDKYLMIAKLYSQGYPLQVLSKISGIPIGEISLILNLSMKK
ncbi:MAG: hypothetical protein ACUVRK_03020 [Spirochaetota bacterium]